MIAFFGAELRMGIEIILDTVDFDGKLEGADFVFSGEGRIDSQSARKVIAGVAKGQSARGAPIAVVGDIGEGIEPLYEMGLAAVFSINRARLISRARARSRAIGTHYG